MSYKGDFAEDSTVYVFFTTHDGDGGAVAPSDAFENTDVKIYKNGAANEKTTANGLTMTSPFDSVTGLHLLAIDTSNDTGDDGFWATGSDYSVVLSPDETVDSQAVVRVIGEFSIENRYMRGTDSANTRTPLDAAGIRGAIGLASADLDTQLTALSEYVDCLPATLDGSTFTNLPDVTTDSESRTASKATGFAVAGDAMALTAGERNSVADAIVQRDVDNVEATMPEHCLGTVILAMLESAISGTTWTIKRTDGSTTHATKTVTVDADASPITGVT